MFHFFQLSKIVTYYLLRFKQVFALSIWRKLSTYISEAFFQRHLNSTWSYLVRQWWTNNILLSLIYVLKPVSNQFWSVLYWNPILIIGLTLDMVWFYEYPNHAHPLKKGLGFLGLKDDRSLLWNWETNMIVNGFEKMNIQPVYKTK